MTSKRLTPREVYDVGVSAAENAIKVMQDATILMQADRPLRAYALAVIAVEEAAKHLTCRDLLFDWTGTITVAELNVALRPKGSAHIDRFAAVLYYLRGLNLWGSGPTIEELREFAEKDIRLRERALYVEVGDDGNPMTPDGGVSGESSRQWVADMAGLFGTLSSVWRTALDEGLEAAEADRQA